MLANRKGCLCRQRMGYEGAGNLVALCLGNDTEAEKKGVGVQKLLGIMRPQVILFPPPLFSLPYKSNTGFTVEQYPNMDPVLRRILSFLISHHYVEAFFSLCSPAARH